MNVSHLIFRRLLIHREMSMMNKTMKCQIQHKRRLQRSERWTKQQMCYSRCCPKLLHHMRVHYDLMMKHNNSSHVLLWASAEWISSRWGWLACAKARGRNCWRRKMVKEIFTCVLPVRSPSCSQRNETCLMERRCYCDRWWSASRTFATRQWPCYYSCKVEESIGWMRKLRDNGGNSHRFSSWWCGFSQ